MGTTYTVPTSVTDYSGTEYILPGHANWRPSAHIYGRVVNDSNVIENISMMDEFGVLVPLEPDPLWAGRKVQSEVYSLRTYFTADIEVGQSFLSNIIPRLNQEDSVNLDSGLIGSSLYYPSGTFSARPNIDQKYPLIGADNVDYLATTFSLSEEALKTVVGGEFSVLVGKPFSYGTQVKSVDVANRTITVKSLYGIGGVGQYNGFVRILLPAPDVSDILRFWFTNYIGNTRNVTHFDGDTGMSAANAQDNSFSYTPIWVPMSGASADNRNTIRFRAGETYPIQYGLTLGSKSHDNEMPKAEIYKTIPYSNLSGRLVQVSSMTRPAAGNTVTVVCTLTNGASSHGFSTGDLVIVKGVLGTTALQKLNGAYKITVLNSTTFTYPLEGTTSLSYTGDLAAFVNVISYKGLPIVVPHAWRNVVFDFTDVTLEHDDRDEQARVTVTYRADTEAGVLSTLSNTTPSVPPIASVTNVSLSPDKWIGLGSTATGDGASVIGTVKGITQGFNSSGAASCYAHWSKKAEEGPFEGFFVDYGYRGISSTTYNVSANQTNGEFVSLKVNKIGGLAERYWVKFTSRLDPNVYISGQILPPPGVPGASYGIDKLTRVISIKIDGASGTTTPDNSVAITSLVRVANTYSASGMTTTDIGLKVGDPITISGSPVVSGVSTFDGTFKVSKVDSDDPRIIFFGDNKSSGVGPVNATLHGPSWDLDIETKELQTEYAPGTDIPWYDALYKVTCSQYPPDPNWVGLDLQARARLVGNGADQVFGSASYGNNTHVARTYVKKYDITSFTQSAATYDPLKSSRSTVVATLTIPPSDDQRGYLAPNTGIKITTPTNLFFNGDFIINSKSSIAVSGQNFLQVSWNQALGTQLYEGAGLVRTNGVVQADWAWSKSESLQISIGDTIEVLNPKKPSFAGQFVITEIPFPYGVRWEQAGPDDSTQGDVLDYLGAITLKQFLPASGSPGIALTRSSLGKVSATLTGHQLAVNNKIEVTAADSSYSGIHVISSIAGNVVTWSNSGTAGTSSASQILHRTGSVTFVGTGTMEAFLPLIGLSAGPGTMTTDPNKLTDLDANPTVQAKWWNLPHVNDATIVRASNVVTATMSASAVSAAGGINFDPAHPLVSAGTLGVVYGGLRVQASKSTGEGNPPDSTFDVTVGIKSIGATGDSIVLKWDQTGPNGSAIADLRGLSFIYVPDKDGLASLTSGGSKVDRVFADIYNPGKAAIVIAGAGRPNLTRENYPLTSVLGPWEQRRLYGTSLLTLVAPGSVNRGGTAKASITLGSNVISTTSFDYRWLPHTGNLGDLIPGQLIDGTAEEFNVPLATWAASASGSTSTVLTIPITSGVTPVAQWVGWELDNATSIKYFSKSTITAVNTSLRQITVSSPAASASASKGSTVKIIPPPELRLFPYGTRVVSSVSIGTSYNVTLSNAALVTAISQLPTFTPEHKSLMNQDILIKGGTWNGPNIQNLDGVIVGKEGWYGFHIINGENVTIEDVTVKNLFSDFINVVHGTDATTSQDHFPRNIVVKDSSFHTSGRHGAIMMGVTGIKIQNCSFTNVAHWFYDQESFSDAKVIDFSLEDCTVSDTGLGFMTLHPGLQLFDPPRQLTNVTISNVVDSGGTLRAHLKVVNPDSRPFTSKDVGALIVGNATHIPAYCYIRSMVAWDTVELSVSTIGAAASGQVATAQTAIVKDPALFRDFALKRIDRLDGTLNVLGNIGSGSTRENRGQVRFYGDYTAGSPIIKNVRLLQRADESIGTPFTYDSTHPTWSTDGSIQNTDSVYSPPGTGFKSWIGQIITSIPATYTPMYTGNKAAVSIRSVNVTGGAATGTGIYEITLGDPARLTGTNILSYIALHRINWTGFTMEDCRTSGNGEWAGSHASVPSTSPMILLPICWDRVSIINNVVAARLPTNLTPVYYIVGFHDGYASSTRVRTTAFNGGIPTSNALGEPTNLTWTVSHNYWPRAVDNQFTPSNTITPFSLTSSQNPGYPYPAPTFTVNATSSAASGNLLNEPFIVRYSDITNDQSPTGYQRITLGAGGTAATTKTTIPANANYFMSAKFPGSQTHQYKVVELGQSIVANPESMPTTVTVTTTPASGITPSDAVTISVTVTPASGATVPSGNIRLRRSFNSGAVEEIASADLVGGSASFSLGTLAVGNYQMIAVYDPTNLLAYASSTGTKSFNVATTPPPELLPTTITLSHTPTNPLLFEEIEIVATVTPNIAGYVIFKDAFNGLTTQLEDTWTVAGGIATVTIPRTSYADVPAGMHTISGTFYPTSASYSTSFDTDEILVTAPPEPIPTTLSLSSIPSQAEGMLNSGTLEIIIMVDYPLDGTCTVTDLSGEVLRDLGTVEILDGLGVTTLSSFITGSHYIETIFTPTDPLYLGSSAHLTIESYPTVPTKGWSVGPLNS